jgi:hypothetical protein
MKRSLHIASGISVLFTTLAFGHIMFHDTVDMVSDQREGHLFVTAHTIVAIALGVLSSLGAYILLTGSRRQNAAERSEPSARL